MISSFSAGRVNYRKEIFRRDQLRMPGGKKDRQCNDSMSNGIIRLDNDRKAVIQEMRDGKLDELSNIRPKGDIQTMGQNMSCQVEPLAQPLFAQRLSTYIFARNTRLPISKSLVMMSSSFRGLAKLKELCGLRFTLTPAPPPTTG